jgi:isoamylase
VVLRRQHFFVGQTIPGTDTTDIVWLNPDGTPRRSSDWVAPDEPFLGFMLSGEAGEYYLTTVGEHAHDVTLLVGMNAGSELVQLWLPPCRADNHWELVIDTDSTDGLGSGRLPCGSVLTIGPHSLIVMVSCNEPEPEK